MNRQGRKTGFTLIELLVVIAIISLLVSILLPSLRVARDLARAVVCQINLKNISTAAMFYSHENNEIIPRAYTPWEDGGSMWWDLLWDYMEMSPTSSDPHERYLIARSKYPWVGSVLHCPSASREEYVRSYAVNEALRAIWRFEPPGDPPRLLGYSDDGRYMARQNQLTRPADTAFVGDHGFQVFPNEHGKAGRSQMCWSVLITIYSAEALANAGYDNPTALNPDYDFLYRPRHSDGKRSSIGYMDGHVSFITAGDIPVFDYYDTFWSGE